MRKTQVGGSWYSRAASAPQRATGATLAACFAAVSVVFAGTTLITLVAARDSDVILPASSTLLYGASLAIAPAVFVAVGALTSQLGRTRRVATGLGMAVFAVAFVVRMIADAGDSTKWLLWFTPFGWIERMRPYTDNDPRPLLLSAVVTAALVAGALVLSARRDAGAGAIATSDIARLRPHGLRSHLGLVIRLDAPVLAAWCLGAVAAGFAFGIIAKVASGAVSSSVSDTLDKFGVRGNLVLQYFGVAFLFFATIVALLPVSEIGAASADDAAGRTGFVLTQPIGRVALLAERIALVAVTLVATGLLTGVAAWLGAKTQGVDAGLGRLAGAGLNLVPTALLVLGIGVLALALAPRAAVRVVYGVVIASLLIDLVSSLAPSAGWLGHLSVFHYMALAPVQPVDAVATVATLVIAGLLCGGALVVFGRRDLRAA